MKKRGCKIAQKTTTNQTMVVWKDSDHWKVARETHTLRETKVTVCDSTSVEKGI